MSGKEKLFKVVTQNIDWGPPEAEWEGLAGVDVELADIRFADDEEAVIAAGQGARALILGNGWATRKVFEELSDLKVVSRYGVGYDRVDLEAATEHGVVVANVRTGGVFDHEMSNHTMLLVLACVKKLIPLDRVGKSARWGDRRSIIWPMIHVDGQILGIIGLGDIGKMTADKARAFDLSVIANDPYITPEVAAAHGAELVELEYLLRESDFVSIHCPLTPETHALLGEREFQMMKPTAYLINTARGPIVDERALIKALREGWIAGAGLDVMEKEPPDPDNPLLAMENVIVTPHCAGKSDKATFNVRRKAAENVAHVLTGRWPDSVVNPAIKEKLDLKP